MRRSWVENAKKVQERLKESLIISPLEINTIRAVCGVDVSYLHDRHHIFSAAVVLTYPGLTVVERRYSSTYTDFPYIPGYLAFREVPAIVKALENVRETFGLLLVDGHGMAHPRRFGIASHLGVVTGIPSIGCAKKKLVGDFAEPGKKRGETSPLYHEGEMVGAAVRTRERVKPVFVSPGHMSDIESSIEMIMGLTGSFRIPEPTRQAHSMTVEVRRRMKEGKLA